MATDDLDPPRFQPLSDYVRPSMPTTENFRRLVRQAGLLVGWNQDEPMKDEELLERTKLETLDEIAAPPACGKLLEELQASIADWVAAPLRPSSVYTIVLPPCDVNAVVETWARDQGHRMLEAPERLALISDEAPTRFDLGGEGVLVIPELERWFLRHRNGLVTVRALLAALQRQDRPCVIGCNSWAWAFLAKVASADIMLPAGRTFQAFDAKRLGRWFTELAAGGDLGEVQFKLPGSGEDVLALDEAGELRSDYMEKLAARSLGIPWIAWHLWRTSLRSEPPDTTEKDETRATPKRRGTETLWIAELEEFVIPAEHKQDVLLVFQALLIHGAMSLDELELVLPVGQWPTVIPLMLRLRVLRLDGGTLSGAPASYPAMRDELSAAGFSMDEF